MGKKDFNTQFDRMVRALVQTEAQPSVQLNNQLKAELYECERMLRQSGTGKRISLWYMPMVLNFVIFVMLGTAAVLLTDNAAVAVLAAGICAYMALAGVVLTVVGMRRTELKENITVYIQKGEAGI